MATLFDHLDPPAQRHSPTPVAAAEEIKPEMPELRRRVLLFIRSCGDAGCTDSECQEALEMNPSTQRPRRVELVTAGLVVDSGATRSTPSGRKAVVWQSRNPQR
jgi:hypothetical protein